MKWKHPLSECTFQEMMNGMYFKHETLISSFVYHSLSHFNSERDEREVCFQKKEKKRERKEEKKREGKEEKRERREEEKDSERILF